MPNPSFSLPQLVDNKTYCRDTMVAWVRRGSYRRKNMKVPTASNWRIEFHGNVTESMQEQVMDYMRVLWRAAAGDTNREFSPLHSPFTTRWLVGKGRIFCNLSESRRLERIEQLPDLDDLVACRKFARRFCRDFLYKAMVKADEEGIKLEKDFYKAWGIKPEIPSYSSTFGLTALRNARKAVMPRVDFKTLFPPFKVMK